MKMKDGAEHIVVRRLLRRTVLAGRLAGEADAPALKTAVESRATGGSPVVLDLDGISALSSSYFASALLPLWAGPRRDEAVAPLLANLSAHIVDDVRLALEANNAAIWMVQWKKGAIQGRPEILGKVDELDRQALDVAVAEGQTDATDLFARNRGIGLTAWSTRLGALHQRGLLRRRKEGRRMTYTPPWKE